MSYGASERQHYLVAGEGGAGAALVVFVHGGLWVSGGPRDGIPLLRTCRAALAGPALVASVGYRLTGPAGGADGVVHPAHAEDVAAAMARLARDERGRFDPSRVAVVGHSVGALMAAMVALGRYPGAGIRPRACVCSQGLFDAAAFCAERPEWSEPVVRSMPADRAAWPAAREPAGAAGNGASWLLVHSRDDPWVEQSQTDRFAAYLRGTGRHRVAVLVTRDGGAHDEALARMATAGDAASVAVVKFLRDELGVL